MSKNRLLIFHFAIGVLFTCPWVTAQPHAVIAQYHHVDNNTPASTSISPEQFIQHMKYLQENNFTVLPLESVIESLIDKKELPEKTLVITFDDGYQSIYDTAFPILRQLKFPFTVFISTDPLDNKQGNFMNWDQVREMTEYGATIANHTVNHPYMLDRQSGENDEDWISRLRREIDQAEIRILEETGQSHRILAYPYGEYNPEIQNLLAAMDYVGVAQHSGAIGIHSDFLALPRFPLSAFYARLETMKTKMNTLPFQVLVQEPRSPVSNNLSPTLTVQLEQLNFNWSQLNCFAFGESLRINWIDQGKGIFSITPDEQASTRRWRYNCTAPESGSSRFYWYSKAWVRASDIATGIPD